jgi:hypothetical protein
MRRILAVCLCATTIAAGPAFPQSGTTGQEPIPVEKDAPAGSSGASAGSVAAGGSAIVGVVGLVTLLIVGGVLIAANNN